MIKISKEYGKYHVSKDDTEILECDTIEDITKFFEDNKEISSSEAESMIYVCDEETIGEAMDLLAITALLAWGDRLYHGDAIRIEIKATYEPEDK